MIFEDQNTEFKQEYVDDLNKEVVAFANWDGGTIYIGVQKDGEILGLANPDETSQRIASSLKDSISPDIMPFISTKTIDIEKRKIIEINIAQGTNKPYYIRKNGLKPSGVYVRKGTTKQPVSNEGIREMIRQTNGTSFEEERSLNQELTFVTFKHEMKIRNMKIEKAQMKTLHLIGEDGLYTNLAYLLSDQCPSYVKVALFQGSDKEIFRDREEFTGSILKQMEDAYAYLDNKNKTSATFSGLLRIDQQDYPSEALREALLNSICHRDYGTSASNIINIYDDRTEFISQGGIVPGLTIDSLSLGISKPRNKYLAQLFFRMHLIESYGTGIGKIKRAYQECPKKPLFESAPGVFRVTLPNVFEAKATQNKITNQSETIHEISNKQKSLSEEKKCIVEYVQENGLITRHEVEEMLEIGTTKAYRLLKELCEEGKLKAQGSGKNMKYILIK